MEHPLSLDGIRAILFDLDGTLRHSRPSYDQALVDGATEMGVPFSEEQRRQALRWAHYYFAGSPELANDNETYGHDRDLFLTNYIRRFLTVYGCTQERAAEMAPEIYRQFTASVQREDWIEPAAPATLGKLRAAGYKLGVVSNRSQAFHGLLEELGLGPYFDFALAAGEVNAWKPDSVIFEHAVQRAGTRPACTMYVGDNYYADVVGAQRAGLQPVLFDPEGLFPDPGCPVIRSLKDFDVACSRLPVSD